MRQSAPAPGLVVRPRRDGPLILAGTPGRLRGELRLTNDGAERVSLHGFLVSAHDLPEQPATGQLSGRLPPGASADVTASLVLPPATPPGEYHASLDIAGHEVKATLHVASNPSLEVTPSRIFVVAGATPCRLVVRNTGNVRLQIAPLSRARLTSDPDLTALPLGAAAETEPDDRSVSLDAVLRVPGPAALDPGDVLVLDAEVEVAAEIDGERRYLALLPVATATLKVIVGPVAGPPTKKKSRSTAAT